MPQKKQNHTIGLIPNNNSEASARLDAIRVQRERLGSIAPPVFLRGWNALFYLHPGLHPDDSDQSDGGWPEDLRRIASEAWSRVDAGTIPEDDVYCADAGWAGLCDRVEVPSLEERSRRRELARL